MGRGWWVAAAVGVLGCSDRSAPDAGTALEQETAVARGLALCAERFPQELRTQLLDGWKELPSPRLAAPEGLILCTFRKDSAHLTLAFDCRHASSDRQLERMKEALLEQGGTDLPGLGRAAVRAASRPDAEQLTAWDDDSPCNLTTTWLGEGHEGTVELTRRLLQPVSAPPDAG